MVAHTSLGHNCIVSWSVQDQEKCYVSPTPNLPTFPRRLKSIGKLSRQPDFTSLGSLRGSLHDKASLIRHDIHHFITSSLTLGSSSSLHRDSSTRPFDQTYRDANNVVAWLGWPRCHCVVCPRDLAMATFVQSHRPTITRLVSHGFTPPTAHET